MNDTKFRLLAIFSLVLAFSGCGNLGFNSEKKPAIETGKQTQTFVAEAGLTPKTRFSKSLEYLENGNERQALVELEAYLVDVPGSSSARKLIEQITTDSSEYFPKDYFTVDLASGTSLSTLAKKYLGSALKFYALAKYNNISNPSKVNIGQKIKIPLTQLARMVRDTPNVEEDEPEIAAASEVTDDISQDVANLEAEVDKTEEDEAEEMLDDMADDQLAAIEEIVVEEEIVVVTEESLIADIKELNESGDFAQAVGKVEQLKMLTELDRAGEELVLITLLGYAKEVEAINPTQASKYYFEAGELNLKFENQFAAFENLKRASELDEDNIVAMEEMLVLQKDISDKYHREASTAFRRQQLDLAIATWDKVLAVNPDHSNAQLYRAQAIELKERIEKINKK